MRGAASNISRISRSGPADRERAGTDAVEPTRLEQRHVGPLEGVRLLRAEGQREDRHADQEHATTGSIDGVVVVAAREALDAIRGERGHPRTGRPGRPSACLPTRSWTAPSASPAAHRPSRRSRRRSCRPNNRPRAARPRRAPRSIESPCEYRRLPCECRRPRLLGLAGDVQREQAQGVAEAGHDAGPGTAARRSPPRRPRALRGS